MRVVLVNPPTLNRDRSESLRGCSPTDNAEPYYRSLLAGDKTRRDGPSTFSGEHLGLQSLEASLNAAGHDAAVINACVDLHSNLYRTLQGIEEAAPDLVGFSGPLDVFSENLWLARMLRERGYSGHITLGHDFGTLNHEAILALYPVFDSVVRGEGEVTLAALASAVADSRSLRTVDGVTFRDKAHVIVNPPRSVVTDLDRLPIVTRKDLPKALQLGMSAGLFTKRGCPYRCAFCTTGAVPIAEGFTGAGSWRERSPRAVVDEVQMLVETYGVTALTIVDDLFVAKGPKGSEHALAISHEIKDRGLAVRFMVDCRVDSIDEAIFSQLKRSGLSKVFIGVENASSQVLRSFKKGFAPGIIREKLRILDELGIEFVLGYIFFHPLESVTDIEENLELLTGLGVNDAALFLQSVRIYPGTSLEGDLRSRDCLLGEFPYYSARYADPFVDRLRGMLHEFETLSDLMVIDAQEKRRPVDTRARVFELFVHAMRELVACAKRSDQSGMDQVFEGLVEQLKRELAVGA